MSTTSSAIPEIALPAAFDLDDLVERVRSVTGTGKEIALHEPEFGGNELAYVSDCVTSGWVSSVGAYVERFERQVADVAGTRHAVAVVNGTAALHIALLCAGVRPGDEVMMPSLTFVGTANAASHAGAVPHFIDSHPERLSIDPAALEARLDRIAKKADGVTRNRETGRPIRALVPVHVFGHPADMERLCAIARDWHLTVIEDAAEAIGSTLAGRACGSFGALSIFSFNGNKTVTTGGGGAITTDDPEVARRAKHLTTTARLKHRWSFTHDEVAWNYRLPNLNAALGCAQLERVDSMLERKRTLAGRYIDSFAGFEGAEIVGEPEGTRSNYWLVALRLACENIAVRDRALTALNDDGILARPVWVPMHKLPPYEKAPRGPLPVVATLETSLINLPSSAKLAAS